jgi:hypothetical protein
MVYVFGGYRWTNLSRKLLLLPLKGGKCGVREWEPWESPPARVGHTFTNHKGKLYLFGGEGEGGLLLDDFWVLDVVQAPLNPKWNRLPKAPPARAGHTAWSNGFGFFIAGGIGAEGRRLNDVWRFTTVWTKLSLVDVNTRIEGCDQGLCVLGPSFVVLDPAKGQNPLGTSFARLVEKRDRFANRQAVHDRLFLLASGRVAELRAVLNELTEKNPTKCAEDLVSPERLRAVERELSVLNGTLLKRVTEFWTLAQRDIFEKPQPLQPLKRWLLRPYLKSLLAVRERESRAREDELKLAQSVNDETHDPIIQRIERANSAPVKLSDPVDPIETPVARVDTGLLGEFYADQLRVIEQNDDRIRELDALTRRPSPGDRLRGEKVMVISRAMKVGRQKKAEAEADLKKWRDLVANSETELRRIETCLNFAEDSEAREAEQQAELSKLNAEVKKLEAAVRAELTDITSDKKDQIRKLSKITDDLKIQYKPGTLEEARTTFSIAEADIRGFLKAVIGGESAK